MAKALTDTNVTLEVKDEGGGLSEDADMDNMASFAIKLIRGFSKQIDGNYLFSMTMGWKPGWFLGLFH